MCSLGEAPASVIVLALKPYIASKRVHFIAELNIWKTKVEIRIHEPKRGFQDQKKYFLGRIRN